ncbi:MAG: PQQ-binding-like beta-propeller repeat protein [Pirellulaceae bacterium]
MAPCIIPAVVAVLVVSSGCDAQPSATAEEKAANFASAPAGEASELIAGPWNAWRGPNHNGVTIDQAPPVQWDDTQNVVWKVPLPGRGHASPVVIGDQIILATSDKANETQSVISLDRTTGEQRWQTVVNEGNFNPKIFPTNTHASSTVASNGEQLFVVFNNNESAQLAALDLEGNLLWEKKAADFVPKRYQFGFGSSPIVYENTVIVTSECEDDGSMAAFDVETGDEVWRVARTGATSYSTPAVCNVAGKEQLILSGDQSVVSYDPTSGAELWRVAGPWSVTCGTAVWSDDLVFVSGGFPAQRTMAIRADGSEEIVWENNAKFYEQSMLYHDGYLYGLADTGVAYCWRASDGEEMWKQRLENKVSASPVLAGDHIYIPVERGTVYVFKANPEEFELVAENKVGDTHYATPAFDNNQILMRIAASEGDVKKEWLYCIGSE